MGELRRFGKGHFEEVNGSFRAVDTPQGKPMAGTEDLPDDRFWRFGRSVDDILLVVSGANNAGISAVVPPQ